MTQHADWYSDEQMSGWDRAKAALKNDWEQTKSDFGSDSARDLDQDVDDTVKQASNSDDSFENHEQAFRFGYAAQQNFGSDHPRWDDDLDERLRRDYSGDYDRDRMHVKRAYAYQY